MKNKIQKFPKILQVLIKSDYKSKQTAQLKNKKMK